MPSQLSSFNRILQMAQSQSFATTASKESVDWFRTASRRIAHINDLKFFNDNKANQQGFPVKVGSMYMFYYDPKHKKELPYYDRFPLIFPLESYSDGFLGINMHYLPPLLRAGLMDVLYSYINNINMDETTRLNLSYQVLKGTMKAKNFKPCIKRYLTGHVRSQFLWVDPTEWNIVLFLPLARFEKASINQVYRDSRKKV